MKKLMVLLTGAAFLAVAFGFTAFADEPKPVKKSEEETVKQEVQKPVEKTEETAVQPELNLPNVQPAAATSSSAAFQLNWLSVNGGGAINATSTNYRLGLSVGQSVAGYATSSSYQMGIGFWYGAPSGGCANIKGDMNGDAIYTSSDVVLELNCTYLGLGSCDICFADVTCDGILTSADVVTLLNRTYLGLTNPPWCGP